MERVLKFLKSNFWFLLIIIAIIVVRIFFYTIVIVGGESMKDNLHDRDFLIVNKCKARHSNIARGDIVIFKYDDRILVKRVIGLPNEEVKAIDNKIYINDNVLDEAYLTNTLTSNFNTVFLEDDEYFLMGDNRTNSLDSRYFGPVKKGDIIGVATNIIFPFSRFTTLAIN